MYACKGGIAVRFLTTTTIQFDTKSAYTINLKYNKIFVRKKCLRLSVKIFNLKNKYRFNSVKLTEIIF